MVRYPKEDRESLITLQDFHIRTNEGVEIRFNTIANTEFSPGYADITRIDNRAVISITSGFLSTEGGTAGSVTAQFLKDKRPAFAENFPGISLTLEGEQAENQEFLDAIIQLGALAVLAIFGLLAIQFRSLWQPLLIISAIPFGFAGAIIMHLLKGDTLSMLSVFGILAAAGVAVNDALVFIDRINVLRSKGFSLRYAIMQAGSDRFRPIMLTTVTTFVGLAPIMLETSVQAQFLIPMAMSLAFGVVVASIVTLIMIPCLYSLGEDIMEHTKSLFKQEHRG